MSSQEHSISARSEAMKNWDKARQNAFFEELLNIFDNRSLDLLPFDEVRKSLRLNQKNYRGIQDIPVESIRGSVGRYKDFTRTFMPRSHTMRDRWQRVNATAFDQGLPPIEVYQVGAAYFVLDGNHRVSVARSQEVESIEAHVWEFPSTVGLSSHADLDELLIKTEYADFLAATQLDVSRPEQDIVFTAPGRYVELIYQIRMFQKTLEQIDEEEMPFEEAAVNWFDMIYTPSIMIIHEQDIMERFPERTEADLFIWVWRYHKDLLGEGAKLADAADEVKKTRDPLPMKLWRSVRNFIQQEDEDTTP